MDQRMLALRLRSGPFSMSGLAMSEPANERERVRRRVEWLGGRDSNPDTVVQSHVSYRWTTSQLGLARNSEFRMKNSESRKARNFHYIGASGVQQATAAGQPDVPRPIRCPKVMTFRSASRIPISRVPQL